MNSDSSVQILIPPSLATELQAAAELEHRSPAEVVRDALAAYLEARRWRLKPIRSRLARVSLACPTMTCRSPNSTAKPCERESPRASAPCARERVPTAKHSSPGWGQNLRSSSGKGISEALHFIASPLHDNRRCAARLPPDHRHVAYSDRGKRFNRRCECACSSLSLT